MNEDQNKSASNADATSDQKRETPTQTITVKCVCNKEESNKNKWYAEKIWFPLGLVLLGIILNYLLWKTQFNAVNKQAYFEHKLSTIEKYSKDASQMIYLMRFMDRVHWKETEKTFMVIDSLEKAKNDSFKLFKPVSQTNPYLRLNGQKQTDIDKQLIALKKDSSAFRHSMMANDFRAQYFSSYVMASEFFQDLSDKKNKLISQTIKTLDSMLAPQYYYQAVYDQSVKEKKSIGKFEAAYIDNTFLKSRQDTLKKIIQLMQEDTQP